MGGVKLLIDAEQMKRHRRREEDGSEEEQDLFLRLKGCSEEGVCPVETSEGVADRTTKT